MATTPIKEDDGELSALVPSHQLLQLAGFLALDADSRYTA
jgi:hypothetical protein